MQTAHRFIFQDAANMSSVDDQSIDLVVTSPPYPMIEMWDDQFTKKDPRVGRLLGDGEGLEAFEAMHSILDAVWREVCRVLKEGGFACINVGDATRTVGNRFQLFANHSRIQNAFAALGFDVLPLILWRKQTNAPNKFMGSGMLPAGAYVTLEHEYILIFRKGAKRVFKSAEDKRNRRQSGFFWEERNAWFSDLWDFKGARQEWKNHGSRLRSGAFPLLLPFRLINMYSVLGDTVLDPFAGTGTTNLAAMVAGRNSVGCEIDDGFSAPVRARIFDELKSLNRLNLERIKRHHDFVNSYPGGTEAFKHKNNYFGFPVMTGQESELKLVFVQSVLEVDNNCFAVAYFPDKHIRNLNQEKELAEHICSEDNGVQLVLDFKDS